MTQRLQTGMHPDADQISLFLEGAATEHERAQMLGHLAHCAACREMVFLAQGAETESRPAAALEEPRRAKWWTGRWMPFGLAGAALAFLLALVIYMRRPVAPVDNRQMAGVQQPPAPVIGPRTGVTEQSHPPAIQGSGAGRSTDRLAAPARKPSPAVASGSGGGLGAGVYQPAPSPAVSMNEQATQDARGNMARFAQNAASAAPAAPAAAKMAPQQQAPPLGGPAAAQTYSSGLTVTGRNTASLQILHDRGASEGVGEVGGVVTDATGAVIARATVSLRSAANQAVREVATAEDGRFRIADVPAGRYELRVTSPGFMTASEPLELKSRDVAMLAPVLQVGAESQTVTVEAGNAPMETSNAEVSAATAGLEEKLPGGAAAVARAAIGDRVLALDAAGHLYLSRNARKSWKKIKPKWTGKAAQIWIVPAKENAASETAATQSGAAQVFELTTDSGAAWTSEDGKHWRPRADGNR